MKYKNYKSITRTIILTLVISLISMININADEVQYNIDSVEISTYENVNSINTIDDIDEEMIDYTDDVKVEHSAGTKGLYVSNSDEISDFEIITDDNVIVVEDNLITQIDEGYVVTQGGAEDIDYMYESVEDAYNDNNAIPVSGGAFSGQYIETIEYEDETYVYFYMGGNDVYMNVNDVQLLPKEMSKSTNYYESIDGDWVYHSSIDPITTSETQDYAIQESPEWSQEGVKYYTTDNETFYTDEKFETYAGASYSYFQNLSLRSTTSYDGDDFKDYLTYMGKTGSEYYNDTDAFIEAQDAYNVNGLLLFAMANHESAYGSSTYAGECNNFFGRAAYDSNPDSACLEVGYPTPTDGILSQGAFLSTAYMDVVDYRFGGSNVGDKNGGINYKYASDVDWGAKVANHAYLIDQYLGGEDEDYYRIGRTTSNTYVYTDSDLSTTYKVQQDESNYIYTYNLKSKATYSYFIITDETANAYEVQLITPINNSSSSVCKFTDATNGVYPEFQGYTTENVSQGVASFGCSYDSWENQTGWVNKSKVTITDNNDMNSPSANEVDSNIPDFCGEAISKERGVELWENPSEGIECKALYSNNVMYQLRIDYYDGYHLDETQFSYYNDRILTEEQDYVYDSENRIIVDSNTIYTAKGVIDYMNYITFNDNGDKKGSTYKEYENGRISIKINSDYSSDEIVNSTYYTYYNSGDYKGSTYKEFDGNDITMKINSDYNSNKIYYSQTYYYDSKNRLDTKIIDKYYVQSGNRYYQYEINYYDSGDRKSSYTRSYSYGELSKEVEELYRFDEVYKTKINYY